MKPLHINLLALAFATAMVTLVYFTLGNGFWLRASVTLLFTVPWAIQFLLLAVAANARGAPPPYVSKLTFALWVGAGYIFIGFMAPAGLFPLWFKVISVPIGFLMAYALITVFLGMVRCLPRWRLPWARTE